MKYLWLYFIVVVASLGGWLAGYATGVISGALLFINDSWNLSDTLQGVLVSSVLIGAVIGAAGGMVANAAAEDAERRKDAEKDAEDAARKRDLIAFETLNAKKHRGEKLTDTEEAKYKRLKKKLELD